MKIPMLAILSFPLFCQASHIRPIKDITTQRKYRVAEIRISAKTVQRCVEVDYPGNTPDAIYATQLDPKVCYQNSSR